MRHGGSGQRRKVEEARRMARDALGDDVRLDQPPKYVPTTQTTELGPVRDESVRVLTVGEVAVRLGITRTEVERLIAAGKVRALPTGNTVTVPSSDVERLKPPGMS